MAPDERPEVICPRCSAKIRIHPSTNRIPEHRERGEKEAKRCTFSGDYLPGFTPPHPIRPIRGVLAVAFALLAGCTPASEFEELNPPVGQAYDRDYFGHGWVDIDSNGCDTRNDILQRDLDAEQLADDGCKVLVGVLRHDAYTGRLIYFQRGERTSDEVQIDHVVPLSWAWRAGADAWDQLDRIEFANDPQNLIAVDGPTNSTKGDSGPSDWVPAGNPCWYLDQWARVIEFYRLQPPPEDRATIQEHACSEVQR